MPEPTDPCPDAYREYLGDAAGRVWAERAELRREVARLRAELDRLTRATTMIACDVCGRGERSRYTRGGLCVDCLAAERDYLRTRLTVSIKADLFDQGVNYETSRARTEEIVSDAVKAFREASRPAPQ